MIEFNGERLPLVAWAERLGMSAKTLKKRIAKVGVLAAITLPKRPGKKLAER